MNITDETKAELRRRDDLLRQATAEFVAKDEAGADCPFDVWKRAQAKMADAADRLGAYAVTHMTGLLDALAAAEDERDGLRAAALQVRIMAIETINTGGRIDLHPSEVADILGAALGDAP